jgi:hypothetical protein
MCRLSLNLPEAIPEGSDALPAKEWRRQAICLSGPNGISACDTPYLNLLPK